VALRHKIPPALSGENSFFKYGKRASESPAKYLVCKAREEVFSALESKNPRLMPRAIRLVVKNKFLHTKKILAAAKEVIAWAGSPEKTIDVKGKKFLVFGGIWERAGILRAYNRNKRLFGEIRNCRHMQHVLEAANEGGEMVIADASLLKNEIADKKGLKLAACENKAEGRKRVFA